MFQFPRCPLRDRSQSARPCAGRVAPFGDPRITGCQRLPGAFRRVAASFVGRQRQGIHHAPIMRIPALRFHPADVGAATADRLAPEGPAPPSSAPLRCPARPSCRTASCCVVMCVSICVSMQCARATHHKPPVRHRSRCGPGLGSHEAPSQDLAVSRGRRTSRVPRGALSMCNKGRTPREVVKPRPKACYDLGRGLPTVRSPDRSWRIRWRPPRTPSRGGAAGIRTPDLRRARAALSRLSYGPAPTPRPHANAPAPAGGRAWTRTRDLGLIRAAL
jgi:hypothetical protein